MDVDEVQRPFSSVSILMELPIDNIFQILKFADPADIFVFGQTCKKFLEITLTRTVWLSALRRVCEINSLFKPSFPYDDMSFSELQRAATFGAAQRFTRRLYKSEGDAVAAPLGAFARRVFIPRVTKSSNVASEDAGALKTLDLVPGGRFLIITTDTLVHLWDLGHNATKLIKPHAVASIPLPEPQCEPAISILPTDDGTGIEVMVMAFKLGKVTIENYHIFPVATHPEFIPVSAPCTLGTMMRGFLAKPGHCVLHCSYEIFVWNTVKNLWVSWKVPEFPDKVFAYQDLIICVGDKTISIWEMPTPHCDTAAASCLDSYLPMLTLSHPFPRADSELGLEIPTSTDWFCATSTKPCFLSLVAWKGDVRYIARYMMQSLGQAANRYVPASIPILMETSSMTAASDYLDYSTEIQPCGGDTLTVWTSQRPPVIEVNILPMPTERTAEGPPFKAVRLFEYRGPEERQDDFDFSYCPSSGRLCTITGEGNEIVVLDFLIPSWIDD
ncbi:hypothetical protein B0H13DRAFT_2662858 [Mycena leptocephala]|nr:hypothetical protein B0H13DRAFT_2662858 [Mycena leptocephala]